MSNEEKMKAITPVSYPDLYRDLGEAVKFTLSTKVEKTRITIMIEELAEVFSSEPYNPLLLHFYSTSAENYLISHIVNDVVLTMGFGVSLHLTRENLINLGVCAFCHDFGMMDYTHLFQKDQKLTEQESKMIQRHPARSAEMFKGVWADEVITALNDIHEQVDGQGYPAGKSGAEISFLAKIVSICDVFEALTHQRNARKQIIPYEALKLIIKQKDKMFDGQVVKRFVDYLSIYPVGSLVYLNTGEIGIVTASNYGFPTRAKVRVLLNANREVESSVKIHDLLKDTMVYVRSPVPLREEIEILGALNPRGTFSL